MRGPSGPEILVSYIYSLLKIFKSTVRRNLVSMRYNVANTLLEMVGLVLVVVLLAVSNHEIAHILYILFTNVSTPLIYYRAMENNKKEDQLEAKSNIRLFKRKKTANVDTTTTDLVSSPEDDEERKSNSLFVRKRSENYKNTPPASISEDVEMIDVE